MEDGSTGRANTHPSAHPSLANECAFCLFCPLCAHSRRRSNSGSQRPPKVMPAPDTLIAGWTDRLAVGMDCPNGLPAAGGRFIAATTDRWVRINSSCQSQLRGTQWPLTLAIGKANERPSRNGNWIGCERAKTGEGAAGAIWPLQGRGDTPSIPSRGTPALPRPIDELIFSNEFVSI